MKKILVASLIMWGTVTFAQNTQRIAYIDMEYILENVPEYLNAQNVLDSKVSKWKKNIDKLTRAIEVMKTDLANEKAILTQELIDEKEAEITLKQEELRRLESLYFGPNGDMFQLRKQLVKPVQDQVYNAVQTIASKQRFDFVFDKSTDLVMLYSNKKYDISELVLNSINRERKLIENQKKREEQKTKVVRKLNPTQVEAQKKKQVLLDTKKEEKVAKKIEQDDRKKKLEDARLEKRKKLEERIAAKKKQQEEKRRILNERKEAAKKKKEEQKKKKENN